MIDKETLLKKIENGETVYRVAGSQVREVKLGWGFEVGKYNLLGDVSRNHAKWAFDTLYETKEDAEWALEFGDITRTEKLELPTWDNFKDSLGFRFFSKKSQYCGLQHLNAFNVDTHASDGEIIQVYFLGGDFRHDFEFTKDGYIKACRLCKKLFLEGTE